MKLSYRFVPRLLRLSIGFPRQQHQIEFTLSRIFLKCFQDESRDSCDSMIILLLEKGWYGFSWTIIILQETHNDLNNN